MCSPEGETTGGHRHRVATLLKGMLILLPIRVDGDDHRVAVEGLEA